MLTHIGARRPTEDVVDLLLECHARIRSFTELSQRLAEATGVAPVEVAETAARVRAYFSEALPLHALDEEESILPRLAGRDRQVDASLVAMHRDHVEHAPIVERLVDMCTTLADAPERHAALAPALGAAAATLREHFARHLAEEESIVFPALARLLDAAERAEIVRELRARRQPAPPSGSSR
jgi:iron-sulfur cluster repair protein YtfE (RIC family)